MPKYRRISKKASRRLSRDFHNSVVFRLTQWRITLAVGFNAFGVTMVQAADALKVAFATILKSNTVDRQGTIITPEAIENIKPGPIKLTKAGMAKLKAIDPALPDGDKTVRVEHFYIDGELKGVRHIPFDHDYDLPSHGYYHEGRDL